MKSNERGSRLREQPTPSPAAPDSHQDAITLARGVTEVDRAARTRQDALTRDESPYKAPGFSDE
jgi:hypothetical protein